MSLVHETRNPTKAQQSAEIAEQVAEWETKNGPIQTIPCSMDQAAPAQAFSINRDGKARRNPERKAETNG